MGALVTAVEFLINILFTGYTFVLLLRLLMQKYHVNWHNPLSQFTIRLTEGVLKPVRRFIPGYGGIDYAIVLLAFFIQLVEALIFFWLDEGGMPAWGGLILVAIGELGSVFVNLVFFMTIISALMSWLRGARTHPALDIVDALVSPLLAFVRRFVPLVAGFDLSPIVVLIGLQLINIIFLTSLIDFGKSLLV